MLRTLPKRTARLITDPRYRPALRVGRSDSLAFRKGKWTMILSMLLDWQQRTFPQNFRRQSADRTPLTTR